MDTPHRELLHQRPAHAQEAGLVQFTQLTHDRGLSLRIPKNLRL